MSEFKREQFVQEHPLLLEGRASKLGFDPEKQGWPEEIAIDGQVFHIVDRIFERMSNGEPRIRYAAYAPLRVLVRIYND